MADELGKLQEWYAGQCEEVCAVSVMGPDGDRHYLTFRNGRYFEESEEHRGRTPWQHRYGLNIQSIDCPGWSVAIDLAKTPLEGAIMHSMDNSNGEKDWLRCEIKDEEFIGLGDPLKLVAILDQFLHLSPKCPSVICKEELRTPISHESGEPKDVPAELRAALAEISNMAPDGVLHRLAFRDGLYHDVTHETNAAFGPELREHSDAFDRLQAWYAGQCDRRKLAADAISIGTADNPCWSVSIDLAGTDLDGAIMPSINIDNGDYDWIICNIESNRFSGVGDPSKLVVMLEHFFQLKPKR